MIHKQRSKAQSIDREGKEYFRYDKVLHTKKPNASLLSPLLDSGKITLDLAAHFNEDGSWRDHGMLFKMKPNEVSLLLGDPVEYDLEAIGTLIYHDFGSESNLLVAENKKSVGIMGHSGGIQ